MPSTAMDRQMKEEQTRSKSPFFKSSEFAGESYSKRANRNASHDGAGSSSEDDIAYQVD
jgi:hypothetical protein